MTYNGIAYLCFVNCDTESRNEENNARIHASTVLMTVAWCDGLMTSSEFGAATNASLGRIATTGKSL